MSIRETTIWRKLFPVPLEDFLRALIQKVNLPGVERVQIRVHEAREDDDPVFTIVYEAMQGATVLMRAKEVVDGAEYREALHHHDGDVHADLDQCVKNWVKEKVEDVEARLRAANVNVDIITH